MDIIFLDPIYKDYIWGGNKLKKKYNKNCNRGTNKVIKNKFFNVEKIIVKEIFKSHSNINTLFIMNVIEGISKGEN